MSNGTIKDYTPNFKLIIPQFNIATWHDYMEDNFRAIDAMFHNLFDIQQYKGVWKKLTSYEPKDIVFIGEDKTINDEGVEVDSDFSGKLYKVKVYHTTNTQSDNFSDYYKEHPDYYEPLLDVSIVEYYKDEAILAKNGAELAKNEAELAADAAKQAEISTKDAINEIIYPIRYTNITIPVNSWTLANNNEKYPYEVLVEFPLAKDDQIPEAVFSVDDVSLGIFAPIIESLNGYVKFYATTLLDRDVIVQSLILTDTSAKSYEGDIDISKKVDVDGTNYPNSGLENIINTTIDTKVAETIPQIINITQTSGEIPIETNKIYSLTITGDTLFKLPQIVGSLIHNQIKVMVKVEEDVTIGFGTSYYFNKTKPTLTKGFYDVYFDFDNLLNAWVCGAISKGAND